MMMKTNSDIKIAVVQFGHKEKEEELKMFARLLRKERTADWYFFDETADKDFEIKALWPHYIGIYECIDVDNFEELK